MRLGGRQALREGLTMAAMIDLACAAHTKVGPEGPLVTTVEGAWAYCPTGGDVGHDWQKIEPTALEHLRAGLPTAAPQPAQ
jgi:hypothetical protein